MGSPGETKPHSIATPGLPLPHPEEDRFGPAGSDERHAAAGEQRDPGPSAVDTESLWMDPDEEIGRRRINYALARISSYSRAIA